MFGGTPENIYICTTFQQNPKQYGLQRSITDNGRGVADSKHRVQNPKGSQRATASDQRATIKRAGDSKPDNKRIKQQPTDKRQLSICTTTPHQQANQHPSHNNKPKACSQRPIKPPDRQHPERPQKGVFCVYVVQTWCKISFQEKAKALQVFDLQRFLCFCLVPRAGVEPARVAPLVFETSASTDSAIWACVACWLPKVGAKVI